MRFGISTHLYHDRRLERSHLTEIAEHGFDTIELFATRSHFDYRSEPAVAELGRWLAETGLTKIDCVSFVNPKRVPTMADAEEVAATIHKRDGVAYTGLWLNTRGLERALHTPLDVIGAIRVTQIEKKGRQNRRVRIAFT